MVQAIYETRGRAREFCELALNHYAGCGHGCIDCYGADVTHVEKNAFNKKPHPRLTIEEIRKDIQRLAAAGEKRRVLLSFVTDPYQPIDVETQLTRQTIIALHDAGLKVVILTKGGKRSMRDFDLLGPGDAYATTLTCASLLESKAWEPEATVPQERVDVLKEAHNRNIETWVSFEPVIYPEHTFILLQSTAGFVGHYKVGTMNYHPHGKTINWFVFGWEIKATMDRLGVKYYFKKDLLQKMGVKPEDFKQTWECR